MKGVIIHLQLNGIDSFKGFYDLIALKALPSTHPNAVGWATAFHFYESIFMSKCTMDEGKDIFASDLYYLLR
jgi:hypothetical protein